MKPRKPRREVGMHVGQANPGFGRSITHPTGCASSMGRSLTDPGRPGFVVLFVSSTPKIAAMPNIFGIIKPPLSTPALAV